MDLALYAHTICMMGMQAGLGRKQSGRQRNGVKRTRWNMPHGSQLRCLGEFSYLLLCLMPTFRLLVFWWSFALKLRWSDGLYQCWDGIYGWQSALLLRESYRAMAS